MDWRNEFHKWWVAEFKAVKFPASGTVFNYFIDPDTKKFLPWSESILPYEFDPDTPLQATLVSTSETTRLRIFMDLLLPRRIPIMLVGGAGSGKTVIVNGRLTKLPDSYMVTNVPFNFYTTSGMWRSRLSFAVVESGVTFRFIIFALPYQRCCRKCWKSLWRRRQAATTDHQEIKV